MVLEVDIYGAGYDASQSTIRDIHFSIQAGELVGLIGANGAGKSTTMKSILGLLKAMDGKISFQNDENSYAYVPEHPVYYDELTLWDHIELAAQLNRFDPEEYVPRAEELLKKFKLEDKKHHFPSTFSKGMQQKVLLSLALFIRPALYIVDEPFIGLDPKAIKTFLRLMEEEKGRGAGILMSTHVLDTAEKICDRFLLMSAGSIIFQGTLEQIRAESGLWQGSLMDCFELIMERE